MAKTCELNVVVEPRALTRFLLDRGGLVAQVIFLAATYLPVNWLFSLRVEEATDA